MSGISKRERLKQAKAYRDSKTWSSKVDKMSENQVVAVYLKFERQGKL